MKDFLKVSYAIFLQNFLMSRTYLINLLSGLSSRFVRTGALILIWHINILSGSRVGGFSEILTYYLIGELFIIPFFFQSSIGLDIMKGTFSAKILLPYSVWWTYVWEDIGAGFLYHLTSFVIVVIMMGIFFESLILPSGVIHMLSFLFSVSLALGISIFMSFILGWVAFYTTNTRGVNELFSQISLIFSGRLIPLNMVFSGYGVYINPFASTFYIPVKIYLQQPSIQETLILISSQITWLIAMIFVARFMFRRGMKRYESVGL